jgi:putative endonuclease
MWVVYILRSEKNGRYYIGSTDDLDRRLEQHNSGHTPSTRPYRPWSIVYFEPMPDRPSARSREREIKSWKSRVMIETLIGRASR